MERFIGICLMRRPVWGLGALKQSWSKRWPKWTKEAGFIVRCCKRIDVSGHGMPEGGGQGQRNPRNRLKERGNCGRRFWRIPEFGYFSRSIAFGTTALDLQEVVFHGGLEMA